MTVLADRPATSSGAGRPADERAARASARASASRPRANAPLLAVSLLGGFRVRRADLDQDVSEWQRRSAKVLTKLLATQPGHAMHREQILEVLWPGADPDSALNSFGKAIHAARRAFEPELPRRTDSAYLTLSDSMLALDRKNVVIDADEFEELAENALHSGDVAAYEGALAAYGGELLPEDRYEDWSTRRRCFLAELRVRVLLGLAAEQERRGACSVAADRLREVLHADPTRELAHRQLMRLYADMGTPDQAVRQYHQCEEALRRELDLAPQPETIALYQDISASRVPRQGSVRGLGHEPALTTRALPAEAAPGRPFVGRERVIQRLFEQLSPGSNGGPGLVLLTGEAGIGKTRVQMEFAARASKQGFAVLWGGGGAHATQFGCGPFAIALEGYAATRSPAERDDMARSYPALTRLVPSLRMKDPASPREPSPGDDLPGLAVDIVRLLIDISVRRPVLFVVGDLHGTDASSLDLIRYLAHLAAWRPWLMVAAVREEDVEAGSELGRMIDATMRERLCLRIELRRLSRQGCDRLVRALLPGESVGEDQLDQIYTRSRGNPFFIGELVREIAEDADAMPAGRVAGSGQDAVRVPPRVRALAAMRLASVSETSRRVIGLAATVPAPEISLGDFRAGAAALDPPVTGAEFSDALDHALELGLLEERESGYSFRHPLLRSALYQGLSHHRREQFHAALAAARSATPGRPDDPDPAS